MCSGRAGRHSGGDLRSGEADHWGAVWSVHLGSVQGEVVKIERSSSSLHSVVLFWKGQNPPTIPPCLNRILWLSFLTSRVKHTGSDITLNTVRAGTRRRRRRRSRFELFFLCVFFLFSRWTEFQSQAETQKAKLCTFELWQHVNLPFISHQPRHLGAWHSFLLSSFSLFFFTLESIQDELKFPLLSAAGCLSGHCRVLLCCQGALPSYSNKCLISFHQVWF